MAAYSQSELGFATHFNMYPEVQLPSPNGSLGHTRGQVNCAMARSKALINAGMPVYFVWNRKSHISNGTLRVDEFVTLRREVSKNETFWHDSDPWRIFSTSSRGL